MKLTAARLFALRGWTVKSEQGKFFFSPTMAANDHRKWNGPYATLQHATTAIRRKLQRIVDAD